ncbi:MAG: hypothetical protein ABI720_07135 [Actinomycetes bacterium]
MYVGGRFTNVDRVRRPAIVKLDLQTGERITAFDPPFKAGWLDNRYGRDNEGILPSHRIWPQACQRRAAVC